MTEWLAFALPPATALMGMRLSRLVCGPSLGTRHGLGLRFAVGLAVGTLALSQALLLAAMAGVNASAFLAGVAMTWGIVEGALLVPHLSEVPLELSRHHLWLLLLGPVVCALWVFGRLSTLEGTLEYDAVAFWVFKAKVLYLEQGSSLLAWMHRSDLAYAHWDYPLLVPGIYALGYGAVGRVDEFVNKVWPFWMLVAMCMAILSCARVWARPRPLPVLTVTVLCFLPASLHFVRQEGGTIPMAFFASLAALLLVISRARGDQAALSAAILVLAGGAATKFEGMLYAALWGCAWLALGSGLERRGHRHAGRSLAVAGLCLLPYVLFRLAGPVPHPESAWWRTGVGAPAETLRRFPQLWFLAFAGRFFSRGFFLWDSMDRDHLHWVGRWEGAGSFVNPELSVFPWLLLGVLTVSLYSRRSLRPVLVMLTVAVLGSLTVLSLAMACLPEMHANVARAIDYGRDIVGRYCYPFLLAWFLGAMTPWLMADPGDPSPGLSDPPINGGGETLR